MLFKISALSNGTMNQQFAADFRRATEAKWASQSIDPTLYGYQIQRGTKWLPGLSDEQIAEYEGMVGVRFPNDLKVFLREMNGTDLPTVNVYGSENIPRRKSVGVYSYPRDIELLKELIGIMREHRVEITNDLASQGFDFEESSNVIPIYAHRFVVSTQENPNSSVVLSIVVKAVDAIVYGNSLEEYLIKEFLSS